MTLKIQNCNELKWGCIGVVNGNLNSLFVIVTNESDAGVSVLWSKFSVFAAQPRGNSSIFIIEKSSDWP